MIWIFCSITASLRPGLAYPLGTRTGSLSIATWARSLETIKQYSTHRYLVISRGASLLPPVHEVSGVNEVRAALKFFSDGGRVSPLGFCWFSLLLVSLFFLSVISTCINLLSISVNAVTAEVSFSKSASGMENGDCLDCWLLSSSSSPRVVCLLPLPPYHLSQPQIDHHWWANGKCYFRNYS